MNSSILSLFVDQQQINDERVRSMRCSIGRFLISFKSDQLYGCFRRTLLFIHGGSRTINEYFVPSFSKTRNNFHFLIKIFFTFNQYCNVLYIRPKKSTVCWQNNLSAYGSIDNIWVLFIMCVKNIALDSQFRCTKKII